MDGSSSEDELLDPRRARAMMLLAKALNGPKAGDTTADAPAAASAAAAEEVKFLQSLLQLDPTETLQAVRDRLSVLAIRTGSASVSAKPRASTRAAAPSAQQRSGLDVRGYLEQVRDGDLDCVEPAVLNPLFWHDLLPELAAAQAEQRVDDGGPQPGYGAARCDVLANGFCVVPPSSDAASDAAQATLERLQRGAHRLLALGYPPAFIFMFDAAWAVLDQVWGAMRALLGDDCELDPSVFCWVARVGNGAADGGAQRTGQCGAGEEGGGGDDRAPAGANFGMPHRDFTFLDSVGPDGEPRLLSAWLPLTPVTPANGCIMVVPRPLDRHFSKRWAYAHMRPATEADDGATEVRFDLQVRVAAAKHSHTYIYLSIYQSIYQSIYMYLYL